MTSVKLALGLLAAILLSCLAGVTVVRGEQAWTLIFSSLWFNGLLVLLAISSGFAFFSRIWRRKMTLVSAGMILFHLSFLAVLAGVVVNSLFYFKGILRLTEGETLSNSDPLSYDLVEGGRFFDFARLRGVTKLVRMHTGYMVDGQDKRVAYEIAVGAGDAVKQDLIYITRHLDYEGVRYFCNKEGYSVLLLLSDNEGHQIYGAHLPLQSLKQVDGSYRYTTGSATTPSAIAFPAPPEQPVMDLQVTYHPDPQTERGGVVLFNAWPVGRAAGTDGERSGQASIGAVFSAGDYSISPREVRYWVGISVRYDPAQPLILASLCTGLAGMLLTFIGRIRQDAARRRTERTAPQHEG
ncbi:MAG: hypothetical protein HY901_01935, partial [Deltaproteobacteria bacterium]|nr:hypothetical protein [Deltaproteobacteria bacterium]